MPSAATEGEIRGWCTDYLAQTLELAPGQIDADVKFARLGLDSANSVQMILMLEERLALELDPELVAEFPTIASLARELAIRAGGKTKR